MLDIISHGAITELRLNRPPVNALDHQLLSGLHRAFDEAVAAGTHGIVISGQSGMFSAGVDVPSLLTLDPDGARAYWREFFATAAALATSPVPLAAAITGHSPAGGAVIALMCDWRVMAEGPYKIGLNEVQVGLQVPDCIQLALRRVVGTYRAERLLVSGSMIEASEALAIGYVDELTGVDQVPVRAVRWLEELIAKPAHAMLATRRIARADLTRVWAGVDQLPLEAFLAAYFQPETQATLKALVAKLKAKK